MINIKVKIILGLSGIRSRKVQLSMRRLIWITLNMLMLRPSGKLMQGLRSLLRVVSHFLNNSITEFIFSWRISSRHRLSLLRPSSMTLARHKVWARSCRRLKMGWFWWDTWRTRPKGTQWTSLMTPWLTMRRVSFRRRTT